ncbi:MAG: calcium up-regulated protein [Candidatus Eremiobacteraeota bacterium]|nr:calcium up-regulated protein [Candidatus Eremiobacteraeota bacterium]
MAYTTVTLGTQVHNYLAYGLGNVPANAVDPGTTFTSGCWFDSPDSHWVLILQQDGNLVLYYVVSTTAPLAPGVTFTGDPKWDTKTYKYSGDTFLVGLDGNLVVTSNGSVVWQSGTSGVPAALYLQTDGNVVLYGLAPQIWNTGQHQGPLPSPELGEALQT